MARPSLHVDRDSAHPHVGSGEIATPFVYYVHGALVHCTLPLPGLPQVAGTGASDTAGFKAFEPVVGRHWVRFMPMEVLQSIYAELPWQEILPVDNPGADWQGPLAWHTTKTGRLLVTRAREARFICFAVISEDGATLDLAWVLRGPEAGEPEGAAAREAITHYWLMSILGYAIRLSGRLIMHGNAMAVDEGVVLWLGGKGAGKSTLGLAFNGLDYPLFADDQVVLAVNNSPGLGVVAYRGVQRTRLYEHSLNATATGKGEGLMYPAGRGPGIKGILDLSKLATAGRVPATRPLQGLFMLEPRRPELDAPQFVQLSKSESLRRVMDHRLAPLSLQVGSELVGREFGALAEICRQVPVYSLTMPDRLSALSEVIEGIVARSRA